MPYEHVAPSVYEMGVGQGRGIDGRSYVALSIKSVNGDFMFLLAGDMAVEIGGLMIDQGQAVRAGIILPGGSNGTGQPPSG